MKSTDHLLNRVYLGDGVYVGVDPVLQEYVLWTERADGLHYLHLTHDSIITLHRYAQRPEHP